MPPPPRPRARHVPPSRPPRPARTPQQFPGDPKRRVATPTTVLGVSAATVPWPVPVAGLVSVAHATPDGRGAASALLEPAPAVVPQAATSERRSPPRWRVRRRHRFKPQPRKSTRWSRLSPSHPRPGFASAEAPPRCRPARRSPPASSPGASPTRPALTLSRRRRRRRSYSQNSPPSRLHRGRGSIPRPRRRGRRVGLWGRSGLGRRSLDRGGVQREKSGGAAKGPTAAKETKKETEIGDAANVTVAPVDVSSHAAGALFAALMPPAKKRKARRWLTDDQKTFVCGIDGCDRSYGSASSLCAHKRAHHPGWKEDRKKQREVEAAAALARGDAPDVDAIAKKEEGAARTAARTGRRGGGRRRRRRRSRGEEGRRGRARRHRARHHLRGVDRVPRRGRARAPRGVATQSTTRAARRARREGRVGQATPALRGRAGGPRRGRRGGRRRRRRAFAATDGVRARGGDGEDPGVARETGTRRRASHGARGKILGVVDADLPSDAAAAAETATRISAAVAEAAAKHRSTTRKSAGAAADRKHQSLKAAERERRMRRRSGWRSSAPPRGWRSTTRRRPESESEDGDDAEASGKRE